jgi:hypothetical protein
MRTHPAPLRGGRIFPWPVIIQEKKNVYWKPEIGQSTIRVVPSKYNSDNPFSELVINYALGRTIISPVNWGEKDPINEFVIQLRKTKDKTQYQLSKKLESKQRIFLPIIVRGKEDEGVKLWQFGKEVYMAFLNLTEDEDIGDFTDVLTGRDIVVNTVGPENTGTSYNKSTIMPKMKVSPLSEDKNKIEEWLNNQPNPEEQFTKHSYDEIKSFLAKWLEADNEEGEEEEEESMGTGVNVIKPSDKIKNLFKEE